MEGIQIDMGKFKEKLYRFMYGRYGVDELYKFLLAVFFVLWFAELILNLALPDGHAKTITVSVISILTTIVIFITIFRMLSKNIYKRRRENEAYLKAKKAIRIAFCLNTSRKSKSVNKDDGVYIFRDCTACGSTLRLPRKSGKHSVKCPRCSHVFYVKSK